MKLIDNGVNDLSRPVFLLQKYNKQLELILKYFTHFLILKIFLISRLKYLKEKKGEYRELSIPSLGKKPAKMGDEHILYSFP